MGDVGVGPVHLPGRDDPHGRLLLFHHADLDRRGVGPEKKVFRDVEGRLHVAGGVVLGHVEGFEIVVVQFDLGALGDGEAQRGEDPADLLRHLGDRVQGPSGEPPPGQGHVDPLLHEPSVFLRGLNPLEHRVDPLREGLLDLVGQLSHRGPLLRRHGREAAQDRREHPLATQVLRPDRLDRLVRRGPEKLLLCFPLKLLQLLSHPFFPPAAMPAMSANARGSWTAMSARTLRSRDTPAFLSPSMNRL